jgi:hypothetical protein
MCFAMALSSSTLAKLASTSTPPHPIHLSIITVPDSKTFEVFFFFSSAMLMLLANQ